MSNPLLASFNTPFEVPPFPVIRNEHFVPGIQQAIQDAKAEIDRIISNTEKPTFKNTIEDLESSGESLEMISSILFNLNSAETSEELQKIAQEATPLLTQFDTEVKQNKHLFAKIEILHNQVDNLNINQEQKTLLEKTFKSFIRSGAGLNNEDKKRFQEIAVELGQLGLTFGENVLAETNEFELVIKEENDLSGLPEDVVARAATLAEEKEKSGKWIFTLQAPSYVPFMEYANNRELRKKMYKAYMTKAFKGNERDNQEIINKIVKLRHEKARLLGYNTYADFVLDERMAEQPNKVNDFLSELLEKSKPLAVKEKEELEQYMRKIGIEHPLERWDWAYYSEKLKKEKYDIDDELTKPYFKLENVIDGVFTTAEKLYGINFVPNHDIPVYHADVKGYEVRNGDGELVSVFLADYFPRPGKRPGAWMTSYRSEKKKDGNRQAPIISIVCNFTPSSAAKPSLLKFDEVKTLFHEFGHALHGMLADTHYGSLSGTSVYWDFVELPSQIMENWCFEEECLSLFARHYETGEVIPKEYVDKIKQSANYHEAYATLRQLSFGLLDMAYHAQFLDQVEVGEFEKRTMAETDLFPPVEGTNMSVQFGHIFAGGYASGYYSYKWAEVLDADAFEMFKERGIFNQEVARSFKDNILSRGGTEHPMDLYKRFRGKEPSIDALLKRAGLLN